MRASEVMTPKAQRDLERVWDLKREALILLGHVVAEWDTDPKSVACFDLRIVKRSKEVLAELKNKDPFFQL